MSWRDAVVLVPFVELLAPARRAFARLGTWMPRIETTRTLAASLGPPTAADGESSFDAALDTLVATQLLARERWGAEWMRRDRRGFEHAAERVAATARELARAASSHGRVVATRVVAGGARCARWRCRRPGRSREAARPDRRRMGRERARGVVDRSAVRPSSLGVDRDPGGRRRSARHGAARPGRRSGARRRHRCAARPAVRGDRARARRRTAGACALRRLRGRGLGRGRAGARPSRSRRAAGRAGRARPRPRAPRARAARARRRAHRRRDRLEDVDDARRRERDVAAAGGAPDRQRRRVPRLAQVLAADGDARGGLARRARSDLSAPARLAPRWGRARLAPGRRGASSRGSDRHARRDRGDSATPAAGVARCRARRARALGRARAAARRRRRPPGARRARHRPAARGRASRIARRRRRAVDAGRVHALGRRRARARRLPPADRRGRG